MKVSCTQEALSRGLGIVGRAVAVRSPLPITSNVLMGTDAGRLKLAATNLEITMSCWIDAQVDEEGAIAVQARLLTDFVNTLPNDRMVLSVAPRARQMRVVCARNEASVGGLDAEDFPPTPAVKDGVSVQFDPKGLRQAIAQTVFAAATDDSRPVLTGVHSQLEDKVLSLAASDGFRLSVYRLPLDVTVPERTELVIPAKALSDLNRLLGEEEEPGTLQTNAPPPPSTSRAVVDVADFLRETRSASVFARAGSGIVRLVVTPGEGVTPGKVVISARAEEVGDNEGEIDAAVEGEGVKIAFNGKYLQDVLQALDRGSVALETTGPSSQGAFKPVGTDNYVHVIMPMIVQW